MIAGRLREEKRKIENTSRVCYSIKEYPVFRVLGGRIQSAADLAAAFCLEDKT